MSQLRFNHVFFMLMCLSFVSALFLPAKSTDRVRSSVANIFLPASWPVRKVTALVHDKLVPRRIRDEGSPNQPRLPAEVYAENQQLRTLAASLKGQLLYLQERENERQKLGEIGPFCTLCSVAAGDSGGRDSLMLSATSFDDITAGMPVLYSGGFAGKILRVGMGEARVQLVTDPDFKVQIDFARQVIVEGKPDLIPLNSPPTVLKGRGKGLMQTTVSNKYLDESKLQEGDYATVKDSEFPKIVSGYRIGRVTAISPSKDAGWYSVTVEPFEDLKRLTEVLVVNKLKG